MSIEVEISGRERRPPDRSIYHTNVPLHDHYQRSEQMSLARRLDAILSPLTRMSVLSFFVAVALAQSNQHISRVKNPLAGRPEAIEGGKKRFREACAVCHGGDGEGGRGPNLAESGHLREMTDDQLFNTIHSGIPGTNMPSFPMTASQIWEVVAFVRALSMPAFLMPVHGDAESGRKLFFGESGCGACHMIAGHGGFLGPDLTNIGALRTVAQLRQSILEPNMRRLFGFAGVTVLLKDRSKIEGVAKNISNYSIQVLDAEGKLHLLDRSDVTQIDFQKESLMSANYKRTLPPHGLDNILAFLSKQSVRSNARPDDRANP